MCFPADQLLTDCNGDPIPDGALEKGDFDIGKWFGSHGPDVTRPHIDSVMKGLKEQGVKKFAATGYCWGGRYVVDLVLEVSCLGRAPTVAASPRSVC